MIDFNQFGKSTKAGAAPAATTATPTKSKIDFGQFGKSVTYAPPPSTSDWTDTAGAMVGGMVKGLVSAPLTMVARPFQAVAELAGASAENVDKFSSKYSGGLIAPVPQTYGDVTKDVGRGIQTVALGAAGPSTVLSSGAAFGLGSSLERQGSDVFSASGAGQALAETLIGMGAGKALDLIGKPLLNATGNVIGTITPTVLKDVAAKGGTAVQNFMKNHELLGGIAAPLSKKIMTGAEAFDTGVNKLFSGAGAKAGAAVTSQYPGVSKENIQKHYERSEINRLMEPAKKPGATYKKAAAVVKDAERRGINLEKLAADNKVYASDNISEGKWVTKDIADALEDETMNGGREFLRPALAEAETGVQRVSPEEVTRRILLRIKNTPNAKLSPKQKIAFAKQVVAEYGAGSGYKHGYSLTDLYDAKLNTSAKIYKTPASGGVQSISDTLTGQRKNIESKIFDQILRERAPAELGYDAYMKAQEGKFMLANYLRTLDTKTAPRSLFQRAIRRTSQLGGATAGAQMAGPFGMFSGYQFGGIAADTFAKIPNPIKISYLKSVGMKPPEIYQVMKQYVSEQEATRLVRPLLSGASKVDIGLSKVQNEYGAIPMGYPTSRSNTFANDITQNTRILANTPMLPAPGERIITPNTQGVPNQPIAPYAAGGNLGAVGGMTQRINPEANLTREALVRQNNAVQNARIFKGAPPLKKGPGEIPRKTKKIDVNKIDNEDTAINYLRQEYPEGIKLYHLTSKDALNKIQKTGFIGDSNDEVYFMVNKPDWQRSVSGKDEVMIEITLPPEEYGQLLPDPGGGYLGNDEENLIEMVKAGITGQDVTVLADAIKGTKIRTISKGVNKIFSEIPNQLTGTVKPKVDFSVPQKAIVEFKNPKKKFLITTSDNPMGVATPNEINASKALMFRKFMDDNRIAYTKQKGKYGGNPENSNIVEIKNPNQQRLIDDWLEKNSPQNENIMTYNGKAIRYNPRTKEAFYSDISKRDIQLSEDVEDFFSEVNGKKYRFPLYEDTDKAMTPEEFKKIYDRLF